MLVEGQIGHEALEPAVFVFELTQAPQLTDAEVRELFLPLVERRFNERGGVFSPDGKWVAYASDESGQMEIYVRRFVVPNESESKTGARVPRWAVSVGGGTTPVWSSDHEVHYINPGGAMMSTPMATKDMTVEPGTPALLFPTRIVTGGAIPGRQYDVTRDGRFLINAIADDQISAITLLMNWSPTQQRQQ